MEDVIELGSSDEEPSPKKVKTVTNAMVHIPSNIHGVTIKPVKTSANCAKLFAGKNITVTKISNAEAQIKTKKEIKPPDRPVKKATPKLAILLKKIMRKPIGVQSTGAVFNPLSQIKKTIPQTVGKSVVAKLSKPIQVSGAAALTKFPASVTVKKRVAALSNPTNVGPLATNGLQKKSNIAKKRKMSVVPTVDLDDEEITMPTDSPKWYVKPGLRPKDQNEADKEQKTSNKEPETPGYVEITIEDSPIKPKKTKRTRELSTEGVITIDDSPNKTGTVNAEADEGSDNEPNTSKDVPKSKKKLIYNNTNVESIEEICSLEIEFEPIDQNKSTEYVRKEKNGKIVSVTPDQESSVEIAQNQQGDVSVIKTRPVQSKVKPLKPKCDKDESDFEPTYLSFINLCLKLENSEDMKKIVDKKIKAYYRQVPEKYKRSEEFIDMVSSKVSSMKVAPEKMYLYIKDIVDELKLQRKLGKETPIQEAKPKDEETFTFSNDGNLDPITQRQIRKLEKTLKKLNRAIHKLEMQEVDFDDEEDSVYLLTEKYKERMVRVHAKFCQLTNSKLPSEPHLVIEPRPGQPSGPAKCLEAWINKTDPLSFPDFHDVLRCVREANNNDKLGWDEAFIIEEARDLFVRCGRKLQRRRQEKEWRLAMSRLTTNEDPAEKSFLLKKQLLDNRHIANTKVSEVLNKFSDRQHQLKLEAEEIDEETEESSVESEEDETDESSVLGSKQWRKERLRRLIKEQSKKNPTPKTQVTNEENRGEKVNEIKSTGNNDEIKDIKQKSDDDYSSILSDDSYEIGSDKDELYLLQKLHSDNEIRNVSTAESSDSETPIAISDSIDSSSDGDTIGSKKNQPCDVVSIENSSYSEESDFQQNDEKSNKKQSVSSNKLNEGKQIESTSASFIKGINFTDDPLNELFTSSDTESNSADKLCSKNSENSNNSIKVDVHDDYKFDSFSLDSNPTMSISSNEQDNSDNEFVSVIGKNEDSLDGEWDSTTSEKIKEGLLGEHDNDPLVSLGSNEQDNSDGEFVGVTEKRDDVLDGECDNTSSEKIKEELLHGLLSLDSKPSMSISSNEQENSDCEFTSATEKEWDNTSSETIKKGLLDGHDNDPLVSLDSKPIVSISSNEQDISDSPSINVTQKEDETLDGEWDNKSSEKIEEELLDGLNNDPLVTLDSKPIMSVSSNKKDNSDSLITSITEKEGNNISPEKIKEGLLDEHDNDPIVSLGSKPIISISSNDQDNSDSQFTRFIEKREDVLDGEWDNTSFEKIKNGLLDGHDNDPLVSLDSKPIMSVSSNNHDDSDCQSTNATKKRDETIECEWDNTPSKNNMGAENEDYSHSHTLTHGKNSEHNNYSIQEALLDGHDNDPLVLLNSIRLISIDSKDQGNTDGESTNVTEKREHAIEWDNTSSEKKQGVEEHDDDSNSQTVIIVEQLEDSPDHSDESQGAYGLPMTSGEVLSGLRFIGDLGRTLAPSIHNSASTSNVRFRLSDESTSSPVKSIQDEINMKTILPNNEKIDMSRNFDVYTESKYCDTFNSDLEMVSSVVSITKADQIDEAFDRNFDPNQTIENLRDFESGIMSNENSISNLDIPDKHHSGTNLPEKNDSVENEELTTELATGLSIEKPLSEQSQSVEKILEDMFQSEISSVEAPITLSPT